MTSNFDFYQKLFTKLSAGLSTYWQEVATNVVAAFTPVATTLLIIYVTLWGWSMMRGVISEPITDGLSRIIKLSIITGIALNVGRYNTYLANMLWNSPDELAKVVASGYANNQSNMHFLDTLMGKFYDMGQAFNDRANADSGVTGIPDLSLWFIGLLIWVAGICLTGYAAFLLVLSKIMIALFIGIGPLFILMTIFEPTKRFFDSWMGQVLNSVFLVMLTAGAIKLIMTIIQSYLAAPGVTAALSEPSTTLALPAIVFSIIGVLVMVQLPSASSALGGGVAIGTLGAVGWAYSKAKGGMSSMRPTNLRRSFNRAKSDYRIAKSSAKSAISLPGAAYRKITGGRKNKIANG